MQRYTLNTGGSSYGWLSTTSQIEPATMPCVTFIKGLYLAGHWMTQGTGQGGISTVSLSGKRSAENVIKHLTGLKRKVHLNR
jgi:phytoene dehydrogenase-like protein